ncbi:cyclic AMP-responsive element-binding protein 3-like protein 1 [Arapaima gigas]
MDDFSSELFSTFFDDHLLAERNPLLEMDLDPPNPDIQAEHSYSLSGDSAPQSPSMPIKMDEEADLVLDRDRERRISRSFSASEAREEKRYQ